ncbi:MAG TPA: hypothetical protein VGR91_03670, partial [Stellaceae bacterium]|nr:hypothetical protein [Stellaceae bacterium]
MRKRILPYLAVAVFATALGCGALAAQQPTQTQGIKRTILQTHDLPGTNLQSVQGIAEIGPRVAFPHHTHPGVEISYVLQGSLTLNV